MMIINIPFKVLSLKVAYRKNGILLLDLSHYYHMRPWFVSTFPKEIAFCKIDFGFMFYLELQHGPSYVGVEQQTVGSYTGAGITCIFNRDLYKDNGASQNLGRVSVFSSWVISTVCLVTRSNSVCVCALAHTHSTVCGRLLHTPSDELWADAPTRQLVHKWVHQSHTSRIPPCLCLTVTHLRIRWWRTRMVKMSQRGEKER